MAKSAPKKYGKWELGRNRPFNRLDRAENFCFRQERKIGHKGERFEAKYERVYWGKELGYLYNVYVRKILIKDDD